MGKFLIFLIILLIPAIANAVCIIPEEGIGIRENSLLCHGTYNIEKGISIISDNIIVDCNNSALIGNGFGYGILLKNKQNVIVQNCNISNYEIGIYLDNTNNSILRNNYLTKNKFGIALFNSFNNEVNGNLLEENIRSNAINYLLASLVEEKKPIEIEEVSTPQKIIEEVIKIKKPFLEDGQILNEVNLIFSKYFNITQENLEISRTVLYNDSDKSTRIILHLKPKKILLNVSIYEKIPKCVTAYINQLLLETAGYEVIQNDPLILWTFSRLDNEKEISYKVFKNINEECKSLLLAFGIATGFEEFEEKKTKGKVNYILIFLFVIVVIFILYFVTKLYK